MPKRQGRETPPAAASGSGTCSEDPGRSAPAGSLSTSADLSLAGGEALDTRHRAINIAAAALAKKLEEEIWAACDHHFGSLPWDFSRVRFLKFAGNPIEWLQIDGKTYLELHPVESHFNSDGTITISRAVRRLFGGSIRSSRSALRS